MRRLAHVLAFALPFVTACGLFFPQDDDGDDGGGDGEDLFIAVGDQGALLSSDDAVTWTIRTSGLSSALSDVTWGAGTYVAVGQAGKILASDNGVDWTAASSPSSRDLNGVVFHIDRFYAVGGDYSAGGETLVSFDGTTWTRPELAAPQYVLTDIASDGITLAALGLYQSDLQNFGQFTWTEGLGWQQRIDGGVGGTRYDAIASGYPAFAMIGAGTSATSSDGALWTPATIVAVPPMHGLVYAGSSWLAVGDGGGVLTSTDAFLWSAHTTPVGAALRDVSTNGGTHVSVGDAGTILTSADGATWSVMSSPLAVNLRAVTHPRG